VIFVGLQIQMSVALNENVRNAGIHGESITFRGMGISATHAIERNIKTGGAAAIK
jgi:hypothetical protein